MFSEDKQIEHYIDLNKAQIYAWKKGIKTIYYIRLRQQAMEGTAVEGCVSCMI